MDKTTAKRIIYNLNFPDFCRFSYELLKDSYGNNLGYYKKDKFNAFIRKLPVGEIKKGKGFYDSGFKGIYLIDEIPYELFEKPEDIIVDSPYLRKKLTIIKNEFENKIFLPGVQNFFENQLNSLYFLNNLKGFPIEFYTNTIISKYKLLIKEIGLDWNTDFGIYTGNPDSYISNSLDKSIQVLEKITNENRALSIELSNNQKNIRYYNYEKHLKSGVGHTSTNPFYPVFSNEISQKGDALLEFEHLIKLNPSEDELEKFIRRYYQEIFGFKYDRIESQIWLRFPELDINKKNRRLDLFLHNSVSSDWELFELKKTIPLTKNYRDIPTLASEIYSACQQVLNYERILRQDRVKDYFKKEGIEYFEPTLHLVVGHSPSIQMEQWRWLVSSNKNVKVLTYGELIEEMRIRLIER